MDNYIGKHLLVDCYNCRNALLSSTESLLPLLTAAYEKMDTEPGHTMIYEGDEEITVAAYGEKTHICLHAYPNIHYVAADIYSFDESVRSEKAMAILRSVLRPEKIRATSVKRGNINVHKDMKPSTQSRSTAMNKVRRTKRQLNMAGKKVVGYIRRKKKNPPVE